MIGQADYEADRVRMEHLEAKCEKQKMCMIHDKRCVECDGVDISGENCKYFIRGVNENGSSN
jgi:hypothetical protein